MPFSLAYDFVGLCWNAGKSFANGEWLVQTAEAWAGRNASELGVTAFFLGATALTYLFASPTRVACTEEERRGCKIKLLSGVRTGQECGAPPSRGKLCSYHAAKKSFR